MKDILELTLLFDFYGELLTEKQKEVFALYYQDDLSLAEIAADTGVSRQAVWDQLKRTEKSLREYEAALRLITKFEAQKSVVKEMKALAEQTEQSPETIHRCIAKIKALADSILE